MNCRRDQMMEERHYDPRSRHELRKVIERQAEMARVAYGWVEQLQAKLAAALERAEKAEARLAELTTSGPITRAINADPREAARLRESRRQARDGDVHEGLEPS